MVYLFIIFLIILIILSFFIFPQLSPIPYFPSNKKDLYLIIKALNLENNQTIIDLGAGDGKIIFKLAKTAFKKKLNTQFIAIEINPILVFILHIRRMIDPNRENIYVIWKDMFKIDSQLLTSSFKASPNKKINLTFYLYISPWYLEKVIKNLKLEFKNFDLVSYMYPLPKIKPNKIIKGKNKIFLYKIGFYKQNL